MANRQIQIGLRFGLKFSLFAKKSPFYLVCILVTPIQKRGEGLFRSLRTSVVNPMMISKCAARSLTTSSSLLLLRSLAIGNAALFNSKSLCKRTCLPTLTSTVTFRTMSSFFELSAKKIDGSEVRYLDNF